MGLLLGGVALSCVGCGGDDDPDPPSPGHDAGADAAVDGATDQTPPSRPSLIAPLSGDVVRDAADLRLVSSGYADRDGDPHAATEVEVWDVVEGERVERIWSVRLEAPADLLAVRLSQGTFEGPDAARARLGWDDPYAARIRHEDSRGAASEWSEALFFRTDRQWWDVYDTSAVPVFRLGIPPEGWAELASESLMSERVTVEGTFGFEDEEYCVGVRLKGSVGSFRGLDGKAAFKVRFGWDGCGDTAGRFHGLRSLTLNNAVQDSTNLHQTLGYELFRAAGVPAPLANSVELWVNDEPWGLYANVESYTPELLGQWFDDTSGDIYEGACGDFWDGAEACFDLDTNEDASEGRDDLAEMIDVINYAPDETWYADIRTVVDYDRFLTFSALESILAHWDGYTYAPNNFRIYHDPSTDLFTFLPSGIDQTFVGDVDFWGEGLWGPRPIMGGRCIHDPACAADFAARLEEMVVLFEDLDLGVRAQELYDVVAAHVLDDPRKEYDRAWFYTSVRDLQGWIASRPETARAQLP